jgi:hypothetical protein
VRAAGASARTTRKPRSSSGPREDRARSRGSARRAGRSRCWGDGGQCAPLWERACAGRTHGVAWRGACRARGTFPGSVSAEMIRSAQRWPANRGVKRAERVARLPWGPMHVRVTSESRPSHVRERTACKWFNRAAAPLEPDARVPHRCARAPDSPQCLSGFAGCSRLALQVPLGRALPARCVHRRAAAAPPVCRARRAGPGQSQQQPPAGRAQTPGAVSRLPGGALPACCASPAIETARQSPSIAPRHRPARLHRPHARHDRASGFFPGPTRPFRVRDSSRPGPDPMIRPDDPARDLP